MEFWSPKSKTTLSFIINKSLVFFFLNKQTIHPINNHVETTVKNDQQLQICLCKQTETGMLFIHRDQPTIARVKILKNKFVLSLSEKKEKKKKLLINMGVF